MDSTGKAEIQAQGQVTTPQPTMKALGPADRREQAPESEVGEAAVLVTQR